MHAELWKEVVPKPYSKPNPKALNPRTPKTLNPKPLEAEQEAPVQAYALAEQCQRNHLRV